MVLIWDGTTPDSQSIGIQGGLGVWGRTPGNAGCPPKTSTLGMIAFRKPSVQSSGFAYTWAFVEFLVLSLLAGGYGMRWTLGSQSLLVPLAKTWILLLACDVS